MISVYTEQASSKSGDGLICVDWSVLPVLVVDTLPLIVVEMLDVYSTMNDGLPHVHKEEQRYHGVGESHPVSRETHVEDSISLVGDPGGHESLVVWLSCEGSLLLSEAWDVHVDAHLHSRLNFELLDHLDHLVLFLVDMRELRTYLRQVLVEIVLHFLLNILYIDLSIHN
jgi:hypothetical protein